MDRHGIFVVKLAVFIAHQLDVFGLFINNTVQALVEKGVGLRRNRLFCAVGLEFHHQKEGRGNEDEGQDFHKGSLLFNCTNDIAVKDSRVEYP